MSVHFTSRHPTASPPAVRSGPRSLPRYGVHPPAGSGGPLRPARFPSRPRPRRRSPHGLTASFGSDRPIATSTGTYHIVPPPTALCEGGPTVFYVFRDSPPGPSGPGLCRSGRLGGRLGPRPAARQRAPGASHRRRSRRPVAGSEQALDRCRTVAARVIAGEDLAPNHEGTTPLHFPPVFRRADVGRRADTTSATRSISRRCIPSSS